MPVSELTSALKKHSLQIPSAALPQVVKYCELLWDHNERINLTRHTDYRTFVERDVLDTLQLLPFLQPGDRVLDVGSGGGVPGILLKLLQPDLQVTLAESVQKKARVLQSIVLDLGIDVTVHAARGEVVLKTEKFDAVTIRAVANLRKLAFWFRRVGQSFDRMLLIKGPKWRLEFDEAIEAGVMETATVSELAYYKTPGHDGMSFVLDLRFKSPPSAPAPPPAPEEA